MSRTHGPAPLLTRVAARTMDAVRPPKRLLRGLSVRNVSVPNANLLLLGSGKKKSASGPKMTSAVVAAKKPPAALAMSCRHHALPPQILGVQTLGAQTPARHAMMGVSFVWMAAHRASTCRVARARTGLPAPKASALRCAAMRLVRTAVFAVPGLMEALLVRTALVPKAAFVHARMAPVLKVAIAAPAPMALLRALMDFVPRAVIAALAQKAAHHAQKADIVPAPMATVLADLALLAGSGPVQARACSALVSRHRLI